MKENQKTVVIGDESYESLWAKTYAMTPRERPEGKGWKCVREIMNEKGWTMNAASNWAQRNEQKGILEAKPGTRNGRRAMYYRPKIK